MMRAASRNRPADADGVSALSAMAQVTYMAHFRLVFARRGDQETRIIEFDGEDAAEALLIAQRHQSPAQLWENGRHLCTLHRSGNDGEVWIISRENRGSETARAA